MIYLKDYIQRDRIVFLEAGAKSEALNRLIEISRDDRLIADFNEFRRAVFAREAIVTTGIGHHVAIPHIKSDCVNRFFITIGVFPHGVDWDSLDGKPVQIAFLIGGPNDHETYLRILAKLTLVIRNEQLRKSITGSGDPEGVMRQFAKL